MLNTIYVKHNMLNNILKQLNTMMHNDAQCHKKYPPAFFQLTYFQLTYFPIKQCQTMLKEDNNNKKTNCFHEMTNSYKNVQQ